MGEAGETSREEVDRLLFLKDTDGRRDAPVREAAPISQERPSTPRLFACARCLSAITSTGDRVEVSGAYEHTFLNPDGFVYRIGCFAHAARLLPVGPLSTYWSWFPGHSWQVELCAACGEHLGWLFRSDGGSFHGLICTRLVEVQAE